MGPENEVLLEQTTTTNDNNESSNRILMINGKHDSSSSDDEQPTKIQPRQSNGDYHCSIATIINTNSTPSNTTNYQQKPHTTDINNLNAYNGMDYHDHQMITNGSGIGGGNAGTVGLKNHYNQIDNGMKSTMMIMKTGKIHQLVNNNNHSHYNNHNNNNIKRGHSSSSSSSLMADYVDDGDLVQTSSSGSPLTTEQQSLFPRKPTPFNTKEPTTTFILKKNGFGHDFVDDYDEEHFEDDHHRKITNENMIKIYENGTTTNGHLSLKSNIEDFYDLTNSSNHHCENKCQQQRLLNGVKSTKTRTIANGHLKHRKKHIDEEDGISAGHVHFILNNNNNNNDNRNGNLLKHSLPTTTKQNCPEVLVANNHKNGCHNINHSKTTLLLNGKHERVDQLKYTPDSKYNRYEDAPYHIAFLCYISYAVLIIFGYLRDFMRKTGLEKNLAAVERDREGYTPLYKSFDSFYTRNIYRRIRDAWNRPIASVPGAEIDVIDRVSSDQNWTFEYPGTKSRVINMGSYNYLGYAESQGPIHEKIVNVINEHGVGICSSPNELGVSKHVQQLENLMARFLGVESCIVFGMGFATNSTNIQCFVNKGCLIMSDEHNHASLILGCRLSGATIRVFKHNNMKDLEKKICKYIMDGQPKTHEPWKKIFIIVEGIYSMEGTIVNLPELIRIKKKYKCYIYLDEAHSIGALGQNGGGVIDYFGCDPNDVDILMGTFTKSFGAAGGYLAGRRQLVNMIRINSFSQYYANSMSPPVAKQIYCVLESLLGEDGTDEGAKRIKRLADNSRYFRKKLRQLGFIVYGHDDSPVVPLLICFCSKIAAVIRMAHEKGLGFIGAGYPATALTTGRVRFCISAAHTKEMLDRSLEVINEIGDAINIKYSSLSKLNENNVDELD